MKKVRPYKKQSVKVKTSPGETNEGTLRCCNLYLQNQTDYLFTMVPNNMTQEINLLNSTKR